MKEVLTKEGLEHFTAGMKKLIDEAEPDAITEEAIDEMFGGEVIDVPVDAGTATLSVSVVAGQEEDGRKNVTIKATTTYEDGTVVESEGTVTDGEKGVDGKSIFYCKHSIYATESATIDSTNIENGDKEITIADLIVCPNGWLGRVTSLDVKPARTTVVASYIAFLMGKDGRSIHACTYDGVLESTGEIRQKMNAAFDNSYFPNSNPQDGDLFVTASGYVGYIEQYRLETESITDSTGQWVTGDTYECVEYSLVADLNGGDGKSVYDYAVEAGFEGTEEEFAEKLANGEVVQTTGNSETAVMSQKAVTDTFARIATISQESVNKYPSLTEGWVDNNHLMSSGQISGNRNGYCTTPKISVSPNTTYTVTPAVWGTLTGEANRGRAFDENDTALDVFVWTDNADGSSTFTTPANTAYVRFSVLKAVFVDEQHAVTTAPVDEIIPLFNQRFMLVEGTEVPSEFVAYSEAKAEIKKEALPSVFDIKATKKLYGKTIVNFGDSIFGNARPPKDVSTMLAELTGATVHNCAFGGCRMSQHTGHWDAFSMYRLADAIATNDWSLQDEAINYDDRTSYAEEPLAILKSLDFSTVDIVTIAYGTNDWNTGKIDNDNDLYDTTQFGGALRYSIERLLGVYPHLKIFVLCPTYRFWMDDNGEFTEDSDTKITSSRTLLEYIELANEIAKDYHIPFVDNYYELGINKYNRMHYFPSTDGTHHNENGRKLIAEHIAKELF